jgi:hypothetical protein
MGRDVADLGACWTVRVTFSSYITHKLFDFDAVTEISGALDEAWGGQGTDPLSDAGVASVNLQLSDANVPSLVPGRFVQVLTNGVPFFMFKIEGRPRYTQASPDGKHQEFLTYSGRGAGAAVFDEAIIQPEALLMDVDLDTSWRTWSFASINFPNSTTWNPAQEVYEYQDGITYGARVDSVKDLGVDPDDPGDDEVKLYPAPIGFPWPNAPKNGNGFAPTAAYDPVYWVIADGSAETDIGFHFFRGGFTLAGTQQVAIHATADNLFTMFLDGVPIIGEEEDTLVWKGWVPLTLTLPAGFHTVGFVFENIDADVDYNPGGALFDVIAVAVYPGDVETTLTLSLLTSGATDLVESFFSATIWPGWTVGQIIPDFVAENQALGFLTQYPGDTFSALTDSDGEDWDSIDPDTSSIYIPTWSQKVGDSGLDLLLDLYRAGHIDFHFQPDLTLDMWAAATTGGTPAVTFELSTPSVKGNIVSLERGEEKKYANALLVQWAHGWVWVRDTAEITAYGSAVGEMFSPDALPATITDAQRVGRIELASRERDTKVPILLGLEPRVQNEAPYEGLWVLGDYILTPDVDGDSVRQQALAIEWAQDDNGFAAWKLEMNVQWRSAPRELNDLLRSIGGKTLGQVQNHGVPKD